MWFSLFWKVTIQKLKLMGYGQTPRGVANNIELFSVKWQGLLYLILEIRLATRLLSFIFAQPNLPSYTTPTMRIQYKLIKPSTTIPE